MRAVEQGGFVLRDLVRCDAAGRDLESAEKIPSAPWSSRSLWPPWSRSLEGPPHHRPGEGRGPRDRRRARSSCFRAPQAGGTTTLLDILAGGADFRRGHEPRTTGKKAGRDDVSPYECRLAAFREASTGGLAWCGPSSSVPRSNLWTGPWVHMNSTRGGRCMKNCAIWGHLRAPDARPGGEHGGHDRGAQLQAGWRIWARRDPTEARGTLRRHVHGLVEGTVTERRREGTIVETASGEGVVTGCHFNGT